MTAQRLALADAQSERDRPSDAVPHGRSHVEDAASLIARQRLDLIRSRSGDLKG